MNHPKRLLTLAQVTTLGRLPEEDRVVGWAVSGPIIETPNGNLYALQPDGSRNPNVKKVSGNRLRKTV